MDRTIITRSTRALSAGERLEDWKFRRRVHEEGPHFNAHLRMQILVLAWSFTLLGAGLLLVALWMLGTRLLGVYAPP